MSRVLGSSLCFREPDSPTNTHGRNSNAQSYRFRARRDRWCNQLRSPSRRANCGSSVDATGRYPAVRRRGWFLLILNLLVGARSYCFSPISSFYTVKTGTSAIVPVSLPLGLIPTFSFFRRNSVGKYTAYQGAQTHHRAKACCSRFAGHCAQAAGCSRSCL